MPSTSPAGAGGFGLVEVLTALVISTVGLLGLAALLLKGQQAELASYQRTQALVLVQDMVNRISTNRKAAGCYGITEPSGTPYLGMGNTSAYTCTAWGALAMQQKAQADLAAWDALLKGQGETLDGEGTGAMIGARGCIRYDDANRVYTVAVAWQGAVRTEPPADNCATGLYGDERQRRVVAVSGRIADLD